MTKRAAALFRPVSDDRKLAPVAMVANTTERLRPVAQGPFCSSTYVSIAATCPDTCEFKDGGCYAMAGFTGNALRRMDREAHRESLSADDVIAIECELIEGSFRTGRGPIARVPQDGARGGRDLRLHVGGDVSSEEGARMLGAAAYRWRLRGGGSVWTYTHRWVDIDRDAWGSSISVLASVENIEFAHHARKLGYAPALVVDKFASDKAHTLREGKRSLKVIPCPAQTRGTTCVECRLCLDRDLHTMNVAIGFSVHGVEAAKARRRLPVLKAMAA